MKHGYYWRAMQPQDITEIYALAARCHPDLHERKAVLAEKQRLAPQSCFVSEQIFPPQNITAETADTIQKRKLCGYLLAHPWRDNAVPKLDTLLHSLPAAANSLYLHDLALDSSARGQGLAAQAVNLISDYAKQAGFHSINLVAVHHSAPFWQKHGFTIQNKKLKKELTASLVAYGADAHFMIKIL